MSEQLYKARMTSCYPPVIQNILEFQSIIDGEHPEFELLNNSGEQVLADAYLQTMSEQRLAQWEKYLGIVPQGDANIKSRRDAVIARFRGQGKLNTNLIKTIVRTYTGSDCNCLIKDSTLCVELLPFDEQTLSPEQIMSNIKKELSRKVPAHLGVKVEFAYKHWDDIKNDNYKWNLVKLAHKTWEDVMFGRQGNVNELNYTKLDDFYLG